LTPRSLIGVWGGGGVLGGVGQGKNVKSPEGNRGSEETENPPVLGQNGTRKKKQETLGKMGGIGGKGPIRKRRRFAKNQPGDLNSGTEDAGKREKVRCSD